MMSSGMKFRSVVCRFVCLWLGSCATVSGDTRSFDRFQEQTPIATAERDEQDRLIGNCGAIALQISSLLAETPVSFDHVESILDVKDAEKGASLTELAECAGVLGLKSLVGKWRSMPPTSRSYPAILPVVNSRGPHYVVLAGYENGMLLIFDFPRGGWIKQSVFERDYRWSGYSLHVTRSRLAYARLWLITHQRIAMLGALLLILAIFLIQRLARNKKILGLLRMKKRKELSKATAASLAIVMVATGCTRDSPHMQRVGLSPASLVVSKQSDGYMEGECPVELRLTNDGPEPQKLIRVESSCQCTAVEIPKSREIKPYSSLTIPVRVRVPDYGRSLATVVAFVGNSSGASVRPFKAEITMVGDAEPVPRIVSSSRLLDYDLGRADSKQRELYVRTRESSLSPHWIRGLGVAPPDSGLAIDEISVTSTPVAGHENENENERTYLFGLTVTDMQLARQRELPFQFKIPVFSSQEKNPVSSIEITIIDSQRLLCFPALVMFDADRDLSPAGSKRIWVSHGESVQNATDLSVVSTNTWVHALAIPTENIGGNSARIGYVDLELVPPVNGATRPNRTRIEVQAIANDGTRVTGFIDVTFRSSDSS